MSMVASGCSQGSDTNYVHSGCIEIKRTPSRTLGHCAFNVNTSLVPVSVASHYSLPPSHYRAGS